MSKAHSSLGPSKSGRWLKCRASVGFIEANAKRIPQEKPSPYAAEGTEAHKYAEALLKGKKVKFKDPEMEEHVTGFVKYVYTQMKQISGAKLYVEQTGPLYYDSKQVGTADVLIAGDSTVWIIDLKYGAGVSVEAKRNSQLAIYLKSAITKLKLKLRPEQKVVCCIYQPRAQDGRFVRKWETTWREMEHFCGEIQDTAMDILADPHNQPFHCEPETVCRWCPAKVICPTYAGTLLGEVPPAIEADMGLVAIGETTLSEQKAIGFPEAASLKDSQIARLLAVAGDFKDWLKEIEEHAMARHLAGNPVPGTKVVEGRGERDWEDERKARRVLKRLLPRDYQVVNLISPAQAEKKLKNKRGEDKLAALIVKKPGKPKLVHESDGREALDQPTTFDKSLL